MLMKDVGKYIDKRRSVIHVGAHGGQECNWYDEMNFERVLWFEPNRQIFEGLRSNIAKYPNQVAINLGVHDSLKTATLHIASNDGQSSSILEFGTHLKHHPHIHYVRDETIELTRLDEFFSSNGFSIKDFNFLNIDVQGVELNVMKSLGDDIAKLDYIYAEVNEEHLYNKGCLVEEIDSYLAGYGFVRTVTLMTKFHWGDALYVKK